MAEHTFPPRDTVNVLDYLINWGDWLELDTILSSAWTVDDGITIEDESNTTTTTTVWLSGGVMGRTYNFKNVIVTDGGRTKGKVFTIAVAE